MHSSECGDRNCLGVSIVCATADDAAATNINALANLIARLDAVTNIVNQSTKYPGLRV